MVIKAHFKVQNRVPVSATSIASSSACGFSSTTCPAGLFLSAVSSTCTSPSKPGVFPALCSGQQLHCTQSCDLIRGVTRIRNLNQKPVPQKTDVARKTRGGGYHCVLLQIFPSLHTCIIQFYIFMSLNIHE